MIPPNSAPIISNRIRIKFDVDNSSSIIVNPEKIPLNTSFEPKASAKSKKGSKNRPYTRRRRN